MKKALILSVKPKYAYNILTGDKTLELRKRVPKDFKGWVYVYVTKSEQLLTKIINEWCLTKYGTDMSPNGKVFTVNGKIPFRFWFDEYGELFFVDSEDDYKLTYDLGIYYDYDEDIFNKMCLTKSQVLDYGKGKDLYAWHIKNLDIFDKPKQLSEFVNFKKYNNLIKNFKETKYTTWTEQRDKCFKIKCKITKPPQPYMYVWVEEEK